MKKLFCIFLIMGLTTVMSCKKHYHEYYLTSEMKTQIPFQGSEIISFIDDAGDTIVLHGGNRINEIHEQERCNGCNDYTLFETEEIYFNNEYYEIHLGIGTSDVSNYLFIGYQINETYFHSYFESPISEECLTSSQLFYDSLEVNSITYFNVFGDSVLYTGIIPIDPYPNSIYYSIEYGVIKIDFSNGTNWELVSIE